MSNCCVLATQYSTDSIPHCSMNRASPGLLTMGKGGISIVAPNTLACLCAWQSRVKMTGLKWHRESCPLPHHPPTQIGTNDTTISKKWGYTNSELNVGWLSASQFNLKSTWAVPLWVCIKVGQLNQLDHTDQQKYEPKKERTITVIAKLKALPVQKIITNCLLHRVSVSYYW